MTQLTDRDLSELAAPLRQVESVTRPAEAPRRSMRMPEIVQLAGIAVGIFLLVAAVLLIAQHHSQRTPAYSPGPAPRPCKVGTPGCGPLPKLPTQRTPMPPETHLRGRPRPGLLRPGTYDSLGVDGIGWHLVFTVPSGWNWTGHALTKGNAAIYFSTSPVLVYQNPCHWDRPQHPFIAPILASPEVSAAALAAQPMRYATTPRVIPSSIAFATARGFDTVEVRLTVPTNIDISSCDHGQYRTWRSADTIRTQQGPGQRDLIAVTNPDQRRLLIDAATFPTTPASVVHEVDAILASVKAGDWG
jgi:hypothetical protein